MLSFGWFWDKQEGNKYQNLGFTKDLKHIVGTKQSIIFKKFANEQGALVTTNKKHQTTRFVASTLRTTSSVAQNLPTIIKIKAAEFATAVQEMRNADAYMIEKQLNKMRDPKMLLKLIGIMQILDSYTKVSLCSQSSKFFPSQVFNVMLETKSKLMSLSDKWEWEDNDIRKANTEAPKKIVNRLIEESLYRPKIFRSNIRSYRSLEEAGLIAEDEKIDDLFDINGESIIPLAGEIMMEELTQADLLEVEKELQEITTNLVDTWKERFKLSKLDKAIHAAFGCFHTEFPTSDVQENEMLNKLITAIVEELPETQTRDLNLHNITLGFKSFNLFWIEQTSKNQNQKVPMCHDMYKNWFEKLPRRRAIMHRVLETSSSSLNVSRSEV